MLSTTPLRNVDQAQHYFLGHDNYYAKEDEFAAKERSCWWGKGASALNLNGQVDAQQFVELLKGHLPDGQQLGKKVGNEIEHRPGFDLTFSVPKSISIAALLGGDERLLLAVLRAVDKALEMIERTCAQARITRKGVTMYENTFNLVVAKFLHDLSREGDPQLHVHCVVMNMTQRMDGLWRSLASQSGDYGAEVTREVNGFFERVRHHAHYYDTIFLAELAYEIKQLGYEIVKTGKYGLFEIAGISKAVMDAYSTRRQQIDAYMKEHGWSSAKAAAVATLKTRIAKQSIHRENLEELWKARSDSKGLDAFQEAKNVANKARHYQPPSDEIDSATREAAKDAVHYAIAHLSETHIAIHEVELMGLALQHVIGEKVCMKSLTEALNECQKKGELILLPSNPNERYFTTKQLLRYEQEILTAVNQKVSTQSIVSQDTLDTFLAKQNHLTAEQRAAIQTLFLSEYRINILEGPTGSGKTTLIKPMMELAKENSYRAILLTPSKEASVDLKKQLRTTPTSLREWIKNLLDRSEYDTVSHFIKTQEKLINTHHVSQHPSIIFVDNATLLSSRQMRDLTAIADKTHRYLILNGDQKSSLPWQSGTPLTQMMDKGAHCAHLTVNLRQQAQPIKEAIQNTLQHHIDKAFEKVGKRILSIEDKEERLTAMAAHYAALDAKEQAKTLVLMPTKAQCEAMNDAIHDALKKENKIAATGIEATVLLPKSLSEVQYQRANNYEKGQWIRFNENFISLKIQRGEYLQIIDLEPTRNLILLNNSKGDKIRWNPQKVRGRSGTVEVFEEKTRELVVGETLCWKRGDKSLDIYNGERLKIEGIKNQQLILSRDNHKRISVNISEPQRQHFDYGYAATPLQKHYQQVDTLIAYQNSTSRQSHQRLFYKELSQAKKTIWIYTENKEALLKNLQKHTGDKLTAIDALIAENDTNKKQQHALPISDYLILIEKAVARAIEENQKNLTPTPKIHTPESLAKEAVQYALAHLTEREAAFEHKQVMQVAIKHVLGDAKPEMIQDAVIEAEKNGELIRGIYSTEGTRWTTPEAIAIERDILKLARQDAGQLQPIADAKLIDAYLAKIKPKEEHAIALREICTNTDRHLLVQGLAGTKKTTMLMYLEPFLKEQGHELLCLAPTHQAVKELLERGLKAQTLDSFLAENRKLGLEAPVHHDKLMIALDENSMTSNRRMHELLQLTHARKIRDNYMGDKDQYTSIESGKPHTLLINHMKTVFLKEIERQKDPTLLKAVKESYQGDFRAAFETLKDSLIEVGKEQVNGKTVDNASKRQKAFRNHYVAKSPQERAQLLATTLTNVSRENLNTLIRQDLKARHELSGTAIEATILVSRDMTEVEKTRASNYYAEDRIRFGYYDRGIHVEKGSYLTVQGVNAKENYLVLKKEDGQTVRWQPPTFHRNQYTGVEAYSLKTREVMAGDFIRWTRSDKTLGLLSPKVAQVIAVHQDLIELRATKITEEGVIPVGDSFQIKPFDAKYQHWEYGYVLTGYGSQGKTKAEKLGLVESYCKKAATKRAFLVMLTRAEYKVTIITDDKARLLEQLLNTPGDKTSALEAIGEWKPITSDKQFQSIVKEPLKDKHKFSEKIQEDVQYSFSDKMSHAKENKSTLTKSFYDAERITSLLHENAETVVEKLLGEPKRRTGNQYHYGSNKGSLKVTIRGDKQGFWYDFETSEGGNLLQLVAKQLGLMLNNKNEFKKALEYAAQLVGGPESLITTQAGKVKTHKKSEVKTHADKVAKLTEEQKKNIQYARQLARESRPIKGTLAETYLRKHRGIHLENYPDNFRFHPRVYSGLNKVAHPALLAIAKDIKGETHVVQAIFLDQKTANKANVEVVKQTWGPSGLYSVDINQHSKSGMTLATEGPETGLSIFAAFPKEHIKILLGKGNFGNVDPVTAGKNLIYCLDNDGEDPKKEKEIHTAVEKFLAVGKNEKVLWMAMPEQVKDYNDLLKAYGVDAVKENIEKAIPYLHYRDKNVSPVTLKSGVFDNIKVELAPYTPTRDSEQRIAATTVHTLQQNNLAIHQLSAELQKTDNALQAVLTELSKDASPSTKLNKTLDTCFHPQQTLKKEVDFTQEIKQKPLEKEQEL